MGDMDDDKLEELMKALGITQPGGGGGAAPTPAKPTPPPKGPEQPSAGEEPPVIPDMPAEAAKVPQFESFDLPVAPPKKASIDLIKDVKLKMKIELGRARLPIQEVLGLQPGSVVELDKLTGDPLDILVNDVLVARGEVLVINENFAIRITEVVTPETRANDQLSR